MSKIKGVLFALFSVHLHKKPKKEKSIKGGLCRCLVIVLAADAAEAISSCLSSCFAAAITTADAVTEVANAVVSAVKDTAAATDASTS